MNFIFDPAPTPSLPIADSDLRYPIRRVFCVGRNFAAHAAEMGVKVDPEAPFYFTKSAHHVAVAVGDIPIAPGTQDYHHEIEFVIALHSGGANICVNDASKHIYGYSLGLDMTRRDLQQMSKDTRRSWDTAKDVEYSGLVAPLRPIAGFNMLSAQLELRVNGHVRQRDNLNQMVWSVEEIIADLSRLYTLGAGDLIFMGTPAGVGPVHVGDILEGQLEGIPFFSIRFY